MIVPRLGQVSMILEFVDDVVARAPRGRSVAIASPYLGITGTGRSLSGIITSWDYGSEHCFVVAYRAFI